MQCAAVRCAARAGAAAPDALNFSGYSFGLLRIVFVNIPLIREVILVNPDCLGFGFDVENREGAACAMAEFVRESGWRGVRR
ncbi:hypothetical protein DP42_5040 [Burkholderia pseudomallei]|nr:hypothetical protein DP42_5040 [Burkholderia pseudomallei]